jgi:hypothetical protein
MMHNAFRMSLRRDAKAFPENAPMSDRADHPDDGREHGASQPWTTNRPITAAQRPDRTTSPSTSSRRWRWRPGIQSP